MRALTLFIISLLLCVVSSVTNSGFPQAAESSSADTKPSKNSKAGGSGVSSLMENIAAFVFNTGNVGPFKGKASNNDLPSDAAGQDQGANFPAFPEFPPPNTS